MIILQVISVLMLVLTIVLSYLVVYKMLKENKELHSENTDQDNLDLTNKQ